MTTFDLPEFSAIVTSYYEERSIDEFYSKLSTALNDLGRSYEIVMVNDGSTDSTFEKLRKLYEEDERVFCIIDFFKNSGQLAAITAAINECRGEAILLIDSDLQLDPGELPLLVEEYDKGCDLVSGYRKNRKDSFFRLLPSKLANLIMRRVSQTTLRDFGCTFKIYNAKVLRAFDLGPNNIFNTASVISRIARYSEVPVTHYPRKYGKSGWTFRKLWQFNMENIVNLSEKPFQFIGLICFLIALLGVIRLAIELIYPITFLDEVTNGLLLNAVLISLLVLVGLICLVGEFAIRNFVAGQRLPKYIIREIYRRDSDVNTR